MKYLLIFSLSVLTAFCANAQKENIYLYSIDLRAAANDEIQVQLKVPKIVKKGTARFQLPKIVPGTYKVYEFGRFVKGFTATTEKGVALTVEREDMNTWAIQNAEKLDNITYYIEDTWDSKLTNFVFEAAGTQISKDSAFVLNFHAVTGFFDKFTDLPFVINIKKPQNLYGSCALPRTNLGGDRESFAAKNYAELQDSPLMYAEPDTIHFNIGKSDFMIHVAASNPDITAQSISQPLFELIQSIRQYMGGKLPSENYCFQIYVSDKAYLSRSYGALEHLKGTVICLQNGDPVKLLTEIINIGSHEYFHILTPLTMRSSATDKFDYMIPQRTKHLWFYEGIVEYMSLHAQVKYGIITPTQFFEQITNKLQYLEIYDNLALTDLSLNCLEDKNRKQYINIYHKGALAALCLDVLIMESTKGKTLMSVCNELLKEYKPGLPFDEETFFDKFTSLTDPVIGDFINKYIADTMSFDLSQYMNYVGVRFEKNGKKRGISPLGGLDNGGFKQNEKGMFYIADDTYLDEFGRDILHLEKGDIIVSWGGIDLTEKGSFVKLLRYMDEVKEGQALDVIFYRNEAKMKASVKFTPVMLDSENVFTPSENATETEKDMRSIWLGNHTNF